MIEVKVRYYGLISDIFDKQEESIHLKEGISIEELYENRYRSSIDNKSPQVSIAINNVITDQKTILKNGDIIDLMPPFAGG